MVSLRSYMAKLRRDKCFWKWLIITGTISCLVVYSTTIHNQLLLQPPPCSSPTTFIPSTLPTCEPCSSASYNAIEEDPISKLDLRLGRWDSSRSYRFFDYVIIGDNYAEMSANNKVCLATQSSIERLNELLRIAAHWSGPISVAVLIGVDEIRLMKTFATWLLRCRTELYSRLALHVAIPDSRPVSFDSETLNAPKWETDCDAHPLPPGRSEYSSTAGRKAKPYPQNHLRNLARKNCQTPYVFLVDIDIVPSIGMLEGLNEFLSKAPKCPLCAYVVPTYELDKRVSKFPSNKTELISFAKRKLAIPFHKKIFIYNQYASNFSRWESTNGNESSKTHISHDVTNFELMYEPFYVAPDSVPPHDERFLGYGYTRNSQKARLLFENIGFCTRLRPCMSHGPIP